MAKKIAIDLGTANSLVYVSGQGVVLNEPTVVALSTDDRKVLAVGKDARAMLGKTPESIQALRPMRDGVIADYLVTEAMLKYFIDQVTGSVRFFKPEVMVSVPAGVTSVESRAVLDAITAAGARTAYLIPEPLAASIGAGIPIGEASGNMIVNSGGGTTEVAITSLGGVVVSESVRTAGNALDAAITDYIRRKYNLVVGEVTAEKIKIEIGAAVELEEPLYLEVKGRGSLDGLPRRIEVSSSEITEAIQGPLSSMVTAVRRVLEKTPPELVSDVIDKGMVLSGGTSLLRNIDKYLTKETGVAAHRADDALFCVAKGAGIAIENMDTFKKSILTR